MGSALLSEERAGLLAGDVVPVSPLADMRWRVAVMCVRLKESDEEQLRVRACLQRIAVLKKQLDAMLN